MEDPTHTVAVDANDLGLLLNVATRYVAADAPPPTDQWRHWVAAMMEKYAVSAGYGLDVEVLGGPEDGRISRIHDPRADGPG